MSIKIRYSSVDGFVQTRSYLTVAGAQAYAHERVGATPEVGSFYAVSGDGVGKIEVAGITLAELFPATVMSPEYPTQADVDATMRAEEAADFDDFVEAYPAQQLPQVHRPAYCCGCSLEQLYLVGCDCTPF